MTKTQLKRIIMEVVNEFSAKDAKALADKNNNLDETFSAKDAKSTADSKQLKISDYCKTVIGFIKEYAENGKYSIVLGVSSADRRLAQIGWIFEQNKNMQSEFEQYFKNLGYFVKNTNESRSERAVIISWE